jgi:hypothetical protein
MYSYKYRSYYRSKGYLIQFLKGSGSESILDDLVTAISELNPELGSSIDNWMVDEIAYPITTDLGSVQFSRDGWDTDFIMGGSQELVLKIHELLKEHPQFESLDVHERDYN